MMKLLYAIGFLIAAGAITAGCGSKTHTKTYKAKLEIKALCMNYTLRLTEGSLDTSLISSSWTNEATGITYANVFGLGSPCTFPASVKEGDEFFFVIDSSAQQQCAVCMAYYPTPPKKLAIRVVEK